MTIPVVAARTEEKPAAGNPLLVNAKRSFVRFVYPFLFDPKSFDGRINSVKAAQWESLEHAVHVWEDAPFSADDLLNHVAHFLNPSVERYATATRWRLTNDARQSPAGLANAEWHLVLPPRRGQSREIPFTLEAVELTLFRVGVGFLTILAKPRSNALPDWMDFLHYFRFARGQRDVGIRATRKGERDETGKTVLAPYFPAFAPRTASNHVGREVLLDILAGLLGTANVPGDDGCWWDEVFVPSQLLPFAGLFLSEIVPEELPLLIYQVRNIFHSGQELHPTAHDLYLDGHPGVLPYTRDAWFTFSLDGGSFVAGRLPETPFFQNQLPEHLHSKYFVLFLLALHQRFTLMKLSEEVAECWPVGTDEVDEQQREETVERVRDGLLAFTARGYFAQVMQQEHHHACYRHWQQTFQVERLYREVHDAVNEMNQHVLARKTERIARLQAEAAERDREYQAKERRKEQEEAARERLIQDRARDLETGLAILATLLGGPALALTFLGAVSPVSYQTAIIGTLVGLGLGVVVFFLLKWHANRRWSQTDKRDPD